MTTNNILYPDGTYVCVKYSKSGKTEALTGFIKDDNGYWFHLEQAKIIGRESFKEKLFLSRISPNFISIKSIGKNDLIDNSGS